MTKRIIKHASAAIVILAALSGLINWQNGLLSAVGLFGNPKLIPTSILIGGIMGMANLKGLQWGVESLLGSSRANTKLIFLSLLRLFIIFAIIIILSMLGLINLLGLLAGMSVTFIIFLKETVKTAKTERESKDNT